MIGRYMPPEPDGFYRVVTTFRDWSARTQFVHPGEVFMGIITKDPSASEALRRQVIAEMASYTVPDLQFGGRGGFVIDGVNGCIVSLEEFKCNINSLMRGGHW